MSTDPEAKLFYGYVQPTPEEAEWDEDETGEDEDEDEDEEADEESGNPWAVYGTSNGCETGLYGYDNDLGYYLAVKESLYSAEWSQHIFISQIDLVRKPEWDEQLLQAAKLWNLDVSNLKVGWHLVCLYF